MVGNGVGEVRLKPEVAKEAARMEGDSVVDIAPSVFATTRNSRNLSELSQSKRENFERVIVLRTCFDGRSLCVSARFGCY